MRTPEEMQVLKTNWLNDPCWDIEDTEGWKEHREELKEWRLKIERKQTDDYKKRMQQKADKLQCSFVLAEYIDGLERQIENMLDRVDDLERKTQDESDYYSDN